MSKSARRVFKCGCHGHLMEIYYDDNDSDGEALSFCIYDIYNEVGDRVLKTPKLIADVYIDDHCSPNEAHNLIKFLETIVKKKKDRKRIRTSENGFGSEISKKAVDKLNKISETKDKG
jgi:hypothetical protein